MKLNSGASEFFGLAWASEESQLLSCSNCGFMMEFMPKGISLTKVKNA